MRAKRWILVSVVVAMVATLSPAGAAVVGPDGRTGFDGPTAAASSGGPVSENTTTVVYGPFDVPAATEAGPSMLANALVREGGCQVLPCLDMPVEKPCTTATSPASRQT